MEPEPTVPSASDTAAPAASGVSGPSENPAVQRGAATGVVAIVPVGSLEAAKSRLGEALDAEERRDLVIDLLGRTIRATAATRGITETIVVTPDREVIALAADLGARTLRQHGRGLNQGLAEARVEAVAAGAEAILVVPVDLPLVTAEALTTIVGELDDPARPVVVLVPDRHGRGTNALLVAPPEAIEFCFGGDSRVAHAACASENGARLVELRESPLALDIDTPDDLLLIEGLRPEAVDVR